MTHNSSLSSFYTQISIVGTNRYPGLHFARPRVALAHLPGIFFGAPCPPTPTPERRITHPRPDSVTRPSLVSSVVRHCRHTRTEGSSEAAHVCRCCAHFPNHLTHSRNNTPTAHFGCSPLHQKVRQHHPSPSAAQGPLPPHSELATPLPPTPTPSSLCHPLVLRTHPPGVATHHPSSVTSTSFICVTQEKKAQGSMQLVCPRPFCKKTRRKNNNNNHLRIRCSMYLCFATGFHLHASLSAENKERVPLHRARERLGFFIYVFSPQRSGGERGSISVFTNPPPFFSLPHNTHTHTHTPTTYHCLWAPINYSYTFFFKKKIRNNNT